MSKKCKAYSESKLGLEPSDNRKAFYAGWDAALREALAHAPEVQEPPAFVLDAYRIETEFFGLDDNAQDHPKAEALYRLAKQPAQQEWPKPKFVRNVDGVPCITLVEHEYLMRSRTSPQPSKPLTDEQLADCVPEGAEIIEREGERTRVAMTRQQLHEFVKSAHGITGETK